MFFVYYFPLFLEFFFILFQVSSEKIQSSTFMSTTLLSNSDPEGPKLYTDSGIPLSGNKIAVIGGGSWGSAIARRLGLNAYSRPEILSDKISLWLKDEIFESRNLVDIINEDHVNRKYLSGIELPTNIEADGDILNACRNADILIFAVPHQYIGSVVDNLVGHISPNCIVISLSKGLIVNEDGPVLISEMIANKLGVQICGVLMGANVALDVASDQFVEATIACRCLSTNDSNEQGHSNASALDAAKLLKDIFSCPHFSIQVSTDVSSVEICGAIKNVVALGAGFCDGLGMGSSTKAAVIRQGIVEMARFCKLCSKSPKEFDIDVILQSCGVGDVIATSFGGRNRKCAEEFVSRLLHKEDSEISNYTLKEGIEDSKDEAEQRESEGQSESLCESRANDLWNEIEEQMLHGQKLQGVATAREVHACIEHFDRKHDIRNEHANAKDMSLEFPLFRKIFNISTCRDDPRSLFCW